MSKQFQDKCNKISRKIEQKFEEKLQKISGKIKKMQRKIAGNQYLIKQKNSTN